MSNPFKTKQFKEEQQKWYHKLKDTGFSDIETFTNKQGYICTNPFVNSDIKNLYQIRQNCSEDYFEEYCATTYLYYAACRAFLAHNPSFTQFSAEKKAKSLPNPQNHVPSSEKSHYLDYKILQLHTEGMSLRRISSYLASFICRFPPGKGRFGSYYKYSHNFVRNRLKYIKEQVRLWNLTHEEGIRYEDYYDREN